MHDSVKDKHVVKVKRNVEKRKAKSRDAARCRRGKEADVFSELSSLVPVPADTVANMDKASIMRLAISHLKLRTLTGGFEENADVAVEGGLDLQYEKALGGFLLVMDNEGEFVYVSENVVKHIGLTQLDLLGQSILDYSHPCDHEEIAEFLGEKHSVTDNSKEDSPLQKTFFARLKCTLTNKGRNVNLKSATYKVIRFRGHRLVNQGLDCWLLIGESIPHPGHVDMPIENSAFITRHSLDMKFTYCDDRMEGVLGYTSDDLKKKSMFEFHHAQDGEYMDKIYNDLFSKGQVWTDHYRFLVKHGGFKWIETQATVIHNSKTDKPQYVICVHYILSEVEEAGKILSAVQEPEKSHHKKGLATSTPQQPVKIPQGPILSTESIFVPRTKEMDSGVCAPKQKLQEEIDMEMGHIAPTAGDEIIPLSFDDQDSDMVTLLQDVLLQATELKSKKQMVQFELSMEKGEEPSTQPLKQTAYETPNLEQLVDQLPHCSQKQQSSSFFKPPQTKLPDFVEEIDMDMRAPFIPMPGEDALLFQMAQPIPLMDECDNGTLHMLGTTESVFNSRPEDPNEVNRKMPIPISILRQEAMQKQEKQYKEMEHKKVTMKVRHPVETNRLETGPPPAKKLCLAAGGSMESDSQTEAVCSPHSAGVYSTPQHNQNIKGSSVLKNLLLTGHDDSSGYDIIKYHRKAQNMSRMQEIATLRDLLTGPLTDTPPITPYSSPSNTNSPTGLDISSSPPPAATVTMEAVTPTTSLNLSRGIPIDENSPSSGAAPLQQPASFRPAGRGKQIISDLPSSGGNADGRDEMDFLLQSKFGVGGDSPIVLSDDMLQVLFSMCQAK